MTEEDTGIATTSHTHPLLHTSMDTIASAPLMLAGVVAISMTVVAFTETVSMAIVMGAMADEELLSQPHTTATTLSPQIASQIVGLSIFKK